MTTEGERFLLDYHERHPGATSFTFADAVNEVGRSSYRHLVDDLTDVKAQRILDLGCGDGYLLEQSRSADVEITGVDMSRAELQLARQRLGDRPLLVEGLASALPFADDAFDAVVSHLALMLMEPLKGVVAEIARVLRAGGWCFAVLGAKEGVETPVLRAFREAWFSTVAGTSHKVPTLGDPLAEDVDELRALFADAGFDAFTAEKLTVRRSADIAQLLEYYGLYYPPASLPRGMREQFLAAFKESLETLQRNGEGLAFIASLLHLKAQKASSWQSKKL